MKSSSCHSIPKVKMLVPGVDITTDAPPPPHPKQTKRNEKAKKKKKEKKTLIK